MATLLEQIEEMEQRVLNAKSVELAATFHDRLDMLRARLASGASEPMTIIEAADAEAPRVVRSEDYERGYQAGYHAGIRKQFADRAVECDHEGIGLPGCPTCDPRTRADLRQRGVAIHDLACGRSPGHPDPLCAECQNPTRED